MSLGTVLVVEDDAAIRRGLVDALRFAGYVPREAADGRAGLHAALAGGIDLVMLDVLMPQIDGVTVLEEIRRARPALPVIMLTARGQEQDRVRGLRAGADDYIVKPFALAELLARIEAVLRRSAERPSGVPKLHLDGLFVDFERREIVLGDGTREQLPPREAELLAYLVSHRGRAVGRDELLQRLWGIDPRGVATRTVDMAIARLRQALRDDPASPRWIISVRGKGYMLADPSAGAGTPTAPRPASPARPAAEGEN